MTFHFNLLCPALASWYKEPSAIVVLVGLAWPNPQPPYWDSLDPALLWFYFRYVDLGSIKWRCKNWRPVLFSTFRSISGRDFSTDQGDCEEHMNIF